MVHVICLLLNIQRAIAFNSPGWCCTPAPHALDYVFCSTFLFVHKHDFSALSLTTAEPLQGTADLSHCHCAVVHPATMQHDSIYSSDNNPDNDNNSTNSIHKNYYA